MADGESWIPERIDDYRILRRLGAGGIGTVFEAEQDEPRRRVALKILRAEVANPEILRRFEQEAQALGSLHHPGIAQIYAVGRFGTPGGTLPYIALEYVDGATLTDFADAHRLDRRQRLEMLASVCDAVQHAHQQGVIHRDLKPANILVGADGHPKVLDFSVSHVAQAGKKDSAGLTQTGHILGTIAYMSPEQARGERAIDTRADVYALGVVGFELLCGRLPHRIDDVPLVDALQVVQSRPAPRLDAVDHTLRGDLTIIVGKALEPERERRYASAAALADDIRRFLADQPITARPPTITYQLSRFIRRNKVLVGSALVALLCLVVGLVLSLLSRREEARQRAVAEQRTDEAHAATYIALLQAAMGFRSAGDVHSARRRLESVTRDLRGWEWGYLWHSTEDEIAHVPMRIAPLPAPAPSADGRRVLFAVEGEGLRLFDFNTFTWSDLPVRDLSLCSLALLPGERVAIASDADSRVHRLDLEGHDAPRLVFTADGPIRQVVLAPDGQHVAVLNQKSRDPAAGCAVQIVDLENFAVRKRLSGPAPGYAVAFSPDGELLAAAMADGHVLVFDLESGELRHAFKGHELVAYHVRFSPDGLRLASIGADRKIRIWSLRSGKEEMTLGPSQLIPQALAFEPDGRTLVSGHTDGCVRHWNLGTGQCEWTTYGAGDAALTGGVLSLTVPSPKSELVYAVCADGVHVRVAGEPLPVVHHHADCVYPFAYDVEFSPSGRHLASAAWDGTVRIWDAATGQPVAALDCPISAFWVKYSPDGKRLVTCQQQGHYSHHLSSWNARTLRQEYLIPVSYDAPCGLFTPAGDAFVLGVESELRVLDPTTLETRKVHTLPGRVTSLVLDPSGTRIACGMSEGQCAILDARTFEPIRVFKPHTATLEALAFSADGERLATGARDAVIRVWDTRSWKELLAIPTPEGRHVFSLRFTRDGRRIFSGSRYPAVRVWDAESGRELLQLQGHADYVHDLELRDDDRVVVSASGDNTVRIWDARPLAERIAERDGVLAAERAVTGKVLELFDALGTLEKVVAAVDADPELDPVAKHAAWNVAIRHDRGAGASAD